MHIYVVTVGVVLLSIVSLSMILRGGIRSKQYKTLSIWVGSVLGLMFVGVIGVNIVPSNYFGIPERFSVFTAVGFIAVLGIYLVNGFGQKSPQAIKN